jgi:DNA polymerase III subunit delta'
MKFADIPGADFIKDKLIKSIGSGKIPHAQLFLGNEGALNLPLALAYTTFLHCENRQDTDACGVCGPCSKSVKYIHPDTNFVFPVGNMGADKDEERVKADRLKTFRSFLLEQPFGNLDDLTSFYGGEDKQVLISKDESREIIKSLSLKPFESRYKIMLVWQPEYLHSSAANGLLKILEEPPPFTIFLLVSNKAEKLLATILSRTQLIKVPMLADEELSVFLTKKKKVELQKAQKIVHLAEGNLNHALKLVDTEDEQSSEWFFNWMGACFQHRYDKLLLTSEEFHQLDRLSQRNLLYFSLSLVRETLLRLAGAGTINRVQGNDMERLQKLSALLTVEKIERIQFLINEAIFHLERNGSAKMVLFDSSIQLAKVINPSKP